MRTSSTKPTMNTALKPKLEPIQAQIIDAKAAIRLNTVLTRE